MRSDPGKSSRVRPVAKGAVRRLLEWTGALLLGLVGMGGWSSAASGQALAKEPRCLPFEVGHAAGNYLVPGALGEIVYRRDEGGERALDAYLQPGGELRPAVMVIHGGGGATGSRVAFVGQFLELLTQSGVHWFSIDYSLGGPERTGAAVADIESAIAFLQCHARRLRIDPSRILLLGEDSGADLAIEVATRPGASPLFGLLLMGGRYPEMSKIGALGASPAGEEKRPDRPFVLMVHGGADTEVPVERAQSFCRTLRVLGGRCEEIIVEGASHRLENWWPTSQWGYREEVRQWIEKVTGLLPSSSRPARRVAGREGSAGALQKGLRYGSATRQTMDAWLPAGPGPFPAVLIVHGGGWEAGDPVTYVAPLFRPLAEAGWAWFSIDYRLTPEVQHPEQIEDLRRALHFISTQAERFRLDPTRLVLLGESASGQMVTLLATTPSLLSPPQTRLAGVVSFYGVYDLTAMARPGPLTKRSIPGRLFGMESYGEAERARLATYSPVAQVRPNGPPLPPLLLVCGTKDGLYPQHQAMVERLREVGANVTSVELSGAPHGLENWEGHPEWAFYKTSLLDWLQRVAPGKESR